LYEVVRAPNINTVFLCRWLENIFTTEETVLKTLNYFPAILKFRDLGMPPNWFFRMGLAELQAISNVSDEDLIAIVAEKGPTKAQKFEKMVKSVARTTVRPLIYNSTSTCARTPGAGTLTENLIVLQWTGQKDAGC
jgi:hypothetical protein